MHRLCSEVVTRPRSNVTTINIEILSILKELVVTRPRSNVTTIKKLVAQVDTELL